MTKPPHIWTREEIDILREFYPHFGTRYVKRILKIEWLVIRHKIDKLGLIKLPREQRRCLGCSTGHQSNRKYGWYCRECSNEIRKKNRRTKDIPIKSRFRELLRSARKRSSVPCDLTVEFLIELYGKQAGKCAYSGIPMVFERWGNGRKRYSISIDQIKPGCGYTKENVTLCCWVVNAGKSDLSLSEYINVCKCVVESNS
jgi:hypothetical protein